MYIYIYRTRLHFAIGHRLNLVGHPISRHQGIFIPIENKLTLGSSTSYRVYFASERRKKLSWHRLVDSTYTIWAHLKSDKNLNMNVQDDKLR